MLDLSVLLWYAVGGPLIIPHRVGGGYTRPYTVFRRRVGLG